jgi:hypothetical protein
MLAGSSEAKCRELIDNDTVLNPPLLVTMDDPSCGSRSGLKLDVKSSPTSGGLWRSRPVQFPCKLHECHGKAEQNGEPVYYY